MTSPALPNRPAPTAPAAESSLEQLLLTDSTDARLTLYLRLHYSPHCAAVTREWLEHEPARLPGATAAFLRTVDMERLGIEQRARARNLMQWLRDASAELFEVLPEAEHLPRVAAFADSEQFWWGGARSTLENFCLVTAKDLARRGDALRADVVRFLGAMDGVRSARERGTPWADWGHARVELPDGSVAEQIPSHWALTSAAGELPGARRHEQLRTVEPARFQLTVGVTPDMNVIVDCQPC